MRDLIVFVVVMAILPMGFRRPFIGLLLFSWLAYMRPQDLCWGFARSMRFSFLAGLTMIFGFIAHEAGVRKFWRPDTRTLLMLALIVLVTVGLYLAPLPPGKLVSGFDSPYVSRYYFEFVKIIAVALFTTGQVDTKQRLRAILWTICLCLAFFGVKGGLFGVLTGGSPILRGPGGMMEDNNDFALALVMNIPMMFYLSRSENNVLFRQLATVGICFSMIAVLLTHSRGAFLAATATLMIMAWRSGKLVQAIGTLGLVAIMFYFLAPAHVIERIASIGEGGKESSAGARLRAWGAALSMIQTYPVLGVGLRQFSSHFQAHAAPAIGASISYVAHNSYLQIWAENGSIAIVLYMWLLGSMYFACRHVRRLGDRHPQYKWIGIYSRMMETTTVGFMVGAFFLNRGHFDLIYHWFALTSCLVFVAHKTIMHGADEDEEVPDEERGVEVRWRTHVPQVDPAVAPRWGR